MSGATRQNSTIVAPQVKGLDVIIELVTTFLPQTKQLEAASMADG